MQTSSLPPSRQKTELNCQPGALNSAFTEDEKGSRSVLCQFGLNKQRGEASCRPPLGGTHISAERMMFTIIDAVPH